MMILVPKLMILEGISRNLGSICKISRNLHFFSSMYSKPTHANFISTRTALPGPGICTPKYSSRSIAFKVKTTALRDLSIFPTAEHT